MLSSVGGYDQERAAAGRRHPASGVHTYLDEPTIVFLTLATKRREPWLAQRVVHANLREAWSEAGDWMVGYYLLMPDHLHMFCAPAACQDAAPSVTVDSWVTYWKRRFKKRLNESPGRGASTSSCRWQEGKAWDTRLRRSESYQEKWHYVRQNPVRGGLVSSPELWPYQGVLNQLRW